MKKKRGKYVMVFAIIVVVVIVLAYVLVFKDWLDKKREEKDKELHPEKHIKKYSKYSNEAEYNRYIKRLYYSLWIYNLPSVENGLLTDDEYEEALILYLEEQHPEITEKEYCESLKEPAIFDYRPYTIFNLFNLERYEKASGKIERDFIKQDILHIEKKLDELKFFYPKSQKAQYHKHFIDEIKKIDKGHI